MKANNLSNRFFFINQSASDSQYARIFPMSNLTCLHMNSDTSLLLTFEDSYVGDHNLVNITVESGKGKEAIKNIVDVINSTQQIAVLADKSTGESIIDNINFSGTLDVSGGSTGTFALSGALTVARAATFNGGVRRFVKLTATAAISSYDSGITHLIGPAAAGLAAESTFTLPTAEDGLYYKFIYVGGATEDVNVIIDTGNTTNFYIVE